MPAIRSAFSNAIAAAGQDLLTSLNMDEPVEEVSFDDLIRSLEVTGQPFPHQLSTADPLTILLALEQSGDWSFSA